MATLSCLPSLLWKELLKSLSSFQALAMMLVMCSLSREYMAPDWWIPLFLYAFHPCRDIKHKLYYLLWVEPWHVVSVYVNNNIQHVI